MPDARARRLRANLTDAERRLWTAIRRCQVAGARFRRQHPLGRYIVDFCALKECLVIEIDGGQHAQRAKADGERTAWLEAQGYRVIRFWNIDILENLEGVLQVIEQNLRATQPLPPP